MQGEIGCVKAGFKCTDASVGQYRFVQLDTSECTAAQTVVEQGGAGTKCFGITYETTANANDHVGVNLSGICTLNVDGNAGAISVGSYLKSDADGQGVATTTDLAEIGAIALQASTTASENILVEIRKFTLSAS